MMEIPLLYEFCPEYKHPWPWKLMEKNKSPTLFCLIWIWRPGRSILTRIAGARSFIWNCVLMKCWWDLQLTKYLLDLSSSQDSWWLGRGEVHEGRGRGELGLRGPPSWSRPRLGDKGKESWGESNGDINDWSRTCWHWLCIIWSLCWGLVRVDIGSSLEWLAESWLGEVLSSSPERLEICEGDEIIASVGDIIGDNSWSETQKYLALWRLNKFFQLPRDDDIIWSFLTGTEISLGLMGLIWEDNIWSLGIIVEDIIWSLVIGGDSRTEPPSRADIKLGSETESELENWGWLLEKGSWLVVPWEVIGPWRIWPTPSTGRERVPCEIVTMGAVEVLLDREEKVVAFDTLVTVTYVEVVLQLGWNVSSEFPFP